MDTLRRLSVWWAAHLLFVPRRIGLLLSLCLAVLPAGCGSDNTDANTTDPHWVTQAHPRSRVAVVFVHGLFGDTDGTWTNANGTTFFQLLKSAPGIGDQMDVFVFGFRSDTLKGGSLDVREAANMLEQSLQYNGVWSYPTVVFVAHSMGGLIAMREMIDNPSRRDQVPLMMFYATPQEGSQITAIAQHVVNNPAVKQMLMADENDFLKMLNDDWGRIPDEDKPVINCAYETAPYSGVMIVPWSSATRFCKDVPTAIEGTDHLTIVKPDRQAHPSMVVLVNALNKYVFGTPSQPMLTTPDFQQEGDHWTYELTDPINNYARLVNNSGRKLSYTIARISSPKLMVLPEDTPKDIPARHSDDLKLVLTMAPGQLQQEYNFTLSVPPLADRLIVVRIRDLDAVQAKQVAVVREVTAQVGDYLSSAENVAALTQLPKDQQFAKIADVAGQSISKTAPDLPAAAKWVVTADALASLGMLAPANAALQNAARASPAIADAPSARLVSSVISASSGKPDIFEATGSAVPDDGDKSPVYADFQHAVVEMTRVEKPANIDPGDLKARENLSAKMQVVPSLKAYGYSMKGDVLWAKGDSAAAKEAYQNASRIQPTPITAKKLEAVKVGDMERGH